MLQGKRERRRREHRAAVKAAIAVLCFTLAFWLVEAAVVKAETDMDELMTEVERFGAQPCDTTLVFWKLAVGGWHLTCPGCAAVPADRFFARALIERIDRWAVMGELSVSDLMRISGECP